MWKPPRPSHLLSLTVEQLPEAAHAVWAEPSVGKLKIEDFEEDQSLIAVQYVCGTLVHWPETDAAAVVSRKAAAFNA